MIDIEVLPDKLFRAIFKKVSLFKISLIHLHQDNKPLTDKLLVCFRPFISHIFAEEVSHCQQKRPTGAGYCTA